MIRRRLLKMLEQSLRATGLIYIYIYTYMHAFLSYETWLEEIETFSEAMLQGSGFK